MALYAAHPTASTTKAVVALSQPIGEIITVANRSSTAGERVWFKVYPHAMTLDADAIAGLTAGADETFVVEPGGTFRMAWSGTVKIAYVAAAGTPAISVMSTP